MKSRTPRSVELFLVSAALLVQWAGCAARRATDSFHSAMLPFASESVSNLVAGTTGGTAVYLGDGHWMTSRRVLNGASTVSIDGETAAIRVLCGGETSDKLEADVAQALGDWVIFEAQEVAGPSAKKPPCYDPDKPVRPGQRVYLIGYPCVPGTMNRRLTLVGTRVVTRPWWLPKGPLYLAGPTTGLAGLAGGAAVVMQDDEVVMLGIFYGPCKTWWAEWPRKALLMVLRPPK
jgi:hypothetical protein